MQWQGRKPVKWVRGLVLTCDICKLDEKMHTFIVIESLTIVKMIVLFKFCSPPPAPPAFPPVVAIMFRNESISNLRMNEGFPKSFYKFG